MKNICLNLRYPLWLGSLCAAVLLPAIVQAQAASLLVSIEWLQQHLQQDVLLVIDAREPTHYQAGHIPGAINIPTETTFATNGDTYRVGGLQHIKALFSQHGLQHDDHIVIYDDGDYINAARIFWVLEVYGHQHVKLLNGGMAQWQDNQLPLETTPNQRPATDYVPMIDHRRLTSSKAMQLALNNTAISIIDARTEKEYSGEESQAERKGHIPGAINIPWNLNITKEDNDLTMLLNDNQLKQQYQTHQDKQIITYCNRGKQSALTYFMLRQIGYDVSVYDGAWLEWGNNPSLPIENK